MGEERPSFVDFHQLSSLYTLYFGPNVPKNVPDQVSSATPRLSQSTPFLSHPTFSEPFFLIVSKSQCALIPE